MSPWPPARVKRDGELRPLRHFVWIRRGSAAEPPEATFSTRAARLRAVSSELDVLFIHQIDYIPLGRPMRPTWQPEAPQSGPMAAQGNQRDAKVTPRKVK